MDQVSEWLLFYSNSAICQLYCGESKLIFSATIESENTLLHDMNIFINKMKTNIIIQLVIHKQEEEMLYT
jgi:hypothetical protein